MALRCMNLEQKYTRKSSLCNRIVLYYWIVVTDTVILQGVKRMLPLVGGFLYCVTEHHVANPTWLLNIISSSTIKPQLSDESSEVVKRFDV